MRRFRGLIVVLMVIPWLASEAAAPARATADTTGGWRRTADGWQRVELFQQPIQYPRPALHPAVVGALEVLMTLTAMLALSGQPAATPAVRQPFGTRRGPVRAYADSFR